ncbi:ABC transporter ATP-binding protein [Streptococcus iniae]
MKPLTSYFKPYLKETILGPTFKLLEAIFELLVPMIIAMIVDQILPRGAKTQLYAMIALLFVFAILGVVVAISAQFFSSKAAIGYTKDLTEALFAKVLSLPKETRDRLTTSSLITRLSSDCFQIQNGINLFLRLFLRAPIIVLGAIIMAYRISPPITLIFLGLVLSLFLFVAVLTYFLNPLYLHVKRQMDRLVALTRENILGIRVIRAFGQSLAEQNHFKEENQFYYKRQQEAGYLSSLVPPVTYFLVNASLVLVIWHGHLQIQEGFLSQGLLIALINYLLQILGELLKVTLLVSNLNQAIIARRRVQTIFDERSEDIDAPLEPHHPITSDLVLNVNHLYFTYPNSSEPALCDLTFSIKKGESLGIIGGTGSGKSTLLQLIQGLYTRPKEELAIYQEATSPKSIRQWRSWIAVVPQKAELFKGTVRSNLTLGQNKDLTDETLWNAIGMARAKDFIKEDNLGLHQEVQAFGRNFSGGQSQRLTIARALVTKKAFLLLDDATSALDYLTESKLLNEIKNLRDTNLILVSQRTRSLENLDYILVLDQGKQVGFGKHKDLLVKCPTYKEIYLSQKGGLDET